jgi:hypothetical protein
MKHGAAVTWDEKAKELVAEYTQLLEYRGPVSATSDELLERVTSKALHSAYLAGRESMREEAAKLCDEKEENCSYKAQVSAARYGAANNHLFTALLSGADLAQDLANAIRSLPLEENGISSG